MRTGMFSLANLIIVYYIKVLECVNEFSSKYLYLRIMISICWSANDDPHSVSSKGILVNVYSTPFTQKLYSDICTIYWTTIVPNFRTKLKLSSLTASMTFYLISPVHVLKNICLLSTMIPTYCIIVYNGSFWTRITTEKLRICYIDLQTI